MRALLLTLALCVASVCCAARPPARPPAPNVGGDGATDVRGPAWLRDCLVYHHAGSAPDRPELCPASLTTSADATVTTDPEGLFGAGLWTPKPIVLRGDALSPDRPLTLSFWWRLRKDMPVDGGFDLFTFQGRGIVSAFVRGKGEWCALQRPTGVLQVYYFPGVQNVNDLYDGDLAAHLDLKAGVWHHTAVVIRRASCVQLYTDGRLVAEASTSGRDFAAADEVRTLSIGGGVVVDEVLLLDRAIDADQVADYYRGVKRLREYATGRGEAPGA